MHELSVTEHLLEVTLRHAQQAGAKSVNNIYLVIGQLSSIIDDSVNFYWEIIAKDTLAQNALLHFRRISTSLECQKCLTVYTPEGDDLTCPSCHSAQIKIITGEEFYVEAIDIEK